MGWGKGKTLGPQGLPLLLLELEAVGDHGDEFRIGGLALGGVDGVAEVALQGLQIAPVPGYLDKNDRTV